jgi:hypothetical protein
LLKTAESFGRSNCTSPAGRGCASDPVIVPVTVWRVWHTAVNGRKQEIIKVNRREGFMAPDF